MKQAAALSLAIVLSVGMPAMSQAQSGNMKGMDMKDHKGMDMKDHKSMGMKEGDKKGQGASHKATGAVTKIDPAKSAVTIAHGPVPTMKWPAMTMTFAVKDKAMLEKLPAGKKVAFEFVHQGKDYVITEVK